MWVFLTILPPTQWKIRNWPFWLQILEGLTLGFPKTYSFTYQFAATQEVWSMAHRKMRVFAPKMTLTALMYRQQVRWPFWLQILEGLTLGFPKIYSFTYQFAATQEVWSMAHRNMRVLAPNVTLTALMCRQQVRWPFWLQILEGLTRHTVVTLCGDRKTSLRLIDNVIL